tara:strand:- start:821 stop:1516 length:696 start_codon:yes stop_codon:yes gene_type:complete
MGITSNTATVTYYKNELYVPHAKPGITDSVLAVEGKLEDFINVYERDCLIKVLGHQLAKEFMDELDSTQPNFLKTSADIKWNDLLNGKAYTNPNNQDETLYWKGIRTKSLLSSSVYDMSFLANYVYYYYEANANVVRTEAGNQQINAKNSERVYSGEKTVNAWNKFVEWVQGEAIRPITYIDGNTIIGRDYYLNNEEVSLFQFIEYANDLVKDTYPSFYPRKWNEINQFGI